MTLPKAGANGGFQCADRGGDGRGSGSRQKDDPRLGQCRKTQRGAFVRGASRGKPPHRRNSDAGAGCGEQHRAAAADERLVPRPARSIESVRRDGSHAASRAAGRQWHRGIRRRCEIFGGPPAKRVQSQNRALPAAAFAANDRGVGSCAQDSRACKSSWGLCTRRAADR
jgi:hypothetical protein